jgi:hypothetical protein
MFASSDKGDVSDSRYEKFRTQPSTGRCTFRAGSGGNMYQNTILAAQQGNLSDANKNDSAPFFTEHFTGALLVTAHHLLRVLGLSAILILAAMFIEPDLTENFKDLSPFSVTEQTIDTENTEAPSLSLLMATPTQISQEQVQDSESNSTALPDNKNLIATQRQQAWVTNWLAKRYRVASDASNMLVSAAYLTAKEIKIDPLLILSVMAIESGLNPFAESPVGAQGLMQVMSKIHHEKFQDLGGIKAALNPVANIRVGALILKDYVKRGGSVEAGLKMYVGAAAFETDGGYGSRVLAEYRRLKDVSAGKKVSIFSNTPVAPILIRPQEIMPVEKITNITQQKTITLGENLQIAKL